MLVQVQCVCGQRLEVDTSLAAPRFPCPKCGTWLEAVAPEGERANAPPGEPGGSPEGLGGTGPSDTTLSAQEQASESTDTAWMPVVGALVAILLICFAVLWALVGRWPGGEGTGAGQGSGALAGSGTGAGAAGDGTGSGESGEGTGSGQAGEGTGSGGSGQDTGWGASGDGTGGSKTEEEANAPPAPPASPSPSARPEDSTAPPSEEEAPSVDKPIQGLADDTVKSPAPAPVPDKAPSKKRSGKSGQAGKSGRLGKRGGGKSIFDKAGSGKRIVYVIDYSGSMHQGGRLAAAAHELIKSVEKLGTKRKFFVIFYDDDAEPMPKKNLIPGRKKNVTWLKGWMGTVRGGGGTDPTDAMLQALRLEPDTIWLLSDGGFSDSVCQAIQAANPEKKVCINTIAFYDRTGEPVLKRIAQENRGDYRFVPAQATPPPSPAPKPKPRTGRRQRTGVKTRTRTRTGP